MKFINYLVVKTIANIIWDLPDTPENCDKLRISIQKVAK